jgi:hypothetical protein
VSVWSTGTPFFLKGFSGGKHQVKNDMVISL